MSYYPTDPEERELENFVAALLLALLAYLIFA